MSTNTNYKQIAIHILRCDDQTRVASWMEKAPHITAIHTQSTRLAMNFYP